MKQKNEPRKKTGKVGEDKARLVVPSIQLREYFRMDYTSLSDACDKIVRNPANSGWIRENMVKGVDWVMVVGKGPRRSGHYCGEILEAGHYKEAHGGKEELNRTSKRVRAPVFVLYRPQKNSVIEDEAGDNSRYETFRRRRVGV